MRKKSNKPKRNVWTDPSPYGTYEGERGNPEQWKSSFQEAMDKDTAKEIVKDESPWTILGIPENSSVIITKRAYRVLLLKHHPDKGGDENLCRKIIAAYTMLVE
jgi:DnaJ-class molecular chaperone